MEAAVETRPRKPAAVKLLQALGIVWLLFGGVPLAIGATVGTDDLGSLYLLGWFFIVAGLFSVAAGWRRPAGLVVGMVALSLILVTVILSPLVALVGFLGARDRDGVREYYASGMKR